MRKTVCDFCGIDIPTPTQANIISLPSGKVEDTCLDCKEKINDTVQKMRVDIAGMSRVQ